MRFPRHAAAPTPQPATYECAGCTITHYGLQNQIPVGWSILRGIVLCADCTSSDSLRARRRALPRTAR
jgi:hypothetical protein